MCNELEFDEGATWNEINQVSEIDRGWKLLELSENAFETNRYIHALSLAETASAIFEECSYQKGMAHAALDKANCFNILLETEQAIDSLKCAISIFADLEDSDHWNFRRVLGQWLYEANRLSEAFEVVESVLLHDQFEVYLEGSARGYFNLGQILCAQDFCNASIKYYEMELEVHKSNRNMVGEGDGEILIARCLTHLKLGNQAERRARRASIIFDCTSNLLKRAMSHCLIGRALNEQSRFAAALPEFDLALELAQSLSNPDHFLIFNIQSHKIRAHEGLGNVQMAEDLRRVNSSLNQSNLMSDR